MTREPVPLSETDVLATSITPSPDGPLGHLGHADRMRQHEVDAAVADGSQEPALEMDRLLVLERPAPLRVEQEGVPDVLEAELLAIGEGLGAGPFPLAPPCPGPEKERQLGEVGMQREGHRF